MSRYLVIWCHVVAIPNCVESAKLMLLAVVPINEPLTSKEAAEPKKMPLGQLYTAMPGQSGTVMTPLQLVWFSWWFYATNSWVTSVAIWFTEHYVAFTCGATSIANGNLKEDKAVIMQRRGFTLAPKGGVRMMIAGKLK
jgi:hypothetical protein